jgi:sugar phosphate isomerase/epimerase
VETSAHKLRFAYSTINWGETADLPKTFCEIREAGWQAVELFFHTLDWMGPSKGLLEELSELKAATTFGHVNVPTDRVQLTKLKHHVDYAAEIGAEAVGLVGGSRLRWAPPSDAEYADLARFCEELAVYARDKGVAVAYHPHVACTIETEEEIDRLMDQSKVLTLCLDASHIALVDEDPIAHIRKYRERTSYIHLKDWARGKFVEMGQGTIGIDFAAILRELDDLRFQGWVVVEQSRSDISPLTSAHRNSAYLKSIGYSSRDTGVSK